MALEKLKVLVETSPGTFDDEVEVLFNPSQIVLNKTVNWTPVKSPERDATESQFTSGEPATLTVSLFFDTYEARTDVRDHTGRIAALATVNGDLHRPPLCRLQWGSFTFEDFQWALQSLTQTFTLFLPEGTPARATLACTFKQWRSGEEEARVVNRSSPDVAKTRVVRRGDTLSSLAAEEYNDASRWRPIAEANGIDNPRRLAPGTVLGIPPLVPGGRGNG